MLRHADVVAGEQLAHRLELAANTELVLVRSGPRDEACLPDKAGRSGIGHDEAKRHESELGDVPRGTNRHQSSVVNRVRSEIVRSRGQVREVLAGLAEPAHVRIPVAHAIAEAVRCNAGAANAARGPSRLESTQARS